MAKGKEKLCIDCLHCKASAQSTVYRWLCFYSRAKRSANYQEIYWIIRKPCRAFKSMED
ncbi:hypothetical protein AGMMS49944_24240 [Spirochaetia bacterium]|nr:hypothetical protein AGMMS49944_24240 [Spirochaetia bacterium]